MENQVALAAESSREGRSSTAAHTPGPWRVAKNCNGKWAVAVDVYRSYGSGFCIADCNQPNPFRHGAGGDAEANARLIAAAPTLLGVCQTLLSVIDELGIDACADFPHLRAIASNAVRNATGA